MKKPVALIFAAALAAGVALAQDNATDPVILTGGGVTVRQSEFEGAMKSLPPQYQAYAMGPGKKQFAEDFLRMKLLAAAGERAGLEKDPEVVNQLKIMRENLVASAQLKKIEETVQVAEADLRQAYEAKKAEFEKASARHILIAFKGSPAAQPGKPELTEEQAKAKAEELRAKIAGGAAFEEIAKAESDDTGSGAQGGSLGEFGRGQMVPEFEQAAFTTEIGKLSPVIRTQFGYHVVKVDARTTTPFEEAKAGLERAERAQKVQAEINKLMEAAQPKFEDSYFGAATPTPATK
jgi:peptidyl-prolyl cis-trans isomerase C